MSGDGPYKKWSRYEKIDKLMNHVKGTDYDLYVPRFSELMDGIIILDNLINEI